MKLEDYIHSGVEILETTFKIKPERTKIFLHNDLTKFNCEPTTTGIFFPIDLTAHLLKLPLEELIPNAFHEYLGHGTFCEHSIYGQQLVEDEIEFSESDTSEKEEFLKTKRKTFEQDEFFFEAVALWTEFHLMEQLNEEEMLEKRTK